MQGLDGLELLVVVGVWESRWPEQQRRAAASSQGGLSLQCTMYYVQQIPSLPIGISCARKTLRPPNGLRLDDAVSLLQGQRSAEAWDLARAGAFYGAFYIP